MKRYVYAELTEEEATLLGDLLAAGGEFTSTLRQKLIPATIPSLPATVMVLHDQHTAYRAVLLLDDLATRPWQELEAMRLGAYEEYGQEISDVKLLATTDLAGLGRIVSEANADSRDEEEPLPFMNFNRADRGDLIEAT